MAEKTKILLVDDEQDILTGIKSVLEKKGCQVFTALESDAALVIFEKEKPQVCILDVHMPDSKLDGVGILKEIRKTDRKTYCIMLSRVDDQERIEAARSAQANRYVMKPLSLPELLKLIEEAGGRQNG